jgi:glycerol-3-phosphate O-acyltransferase
LYKVIETETYVTELLGTPKEKESLFQVLSSASLLKLKLGRIDIRFGKPYSLRHWMTEEFSKRSTPDSLFTPSYSPVHKNILLQAFSFSVLADINRVSVIMPTALVGTIILTLRGRGVGREELVRRVTW